LKALALQELQKPTDAIAEMEIGDGWWVVAKKEKGAVADRIQVHAADWYRAALPQLTELAQAKVQKRLAEVDAPPRGALAKKASNVVDLLALIDLSQDVRKGQWSVTKDGLRSERGDASHVRFPYRPPEEYDFLIEFTSVEGHDITAQLLCKAGTRFAWYFGYGYGTESGFGLVRGKEVEGTPTLVRHTPVEVGRRYSSLVEVRNGSVTAYLDGQLLRQYRTDYSDLSPATAWDTGDDVLGVGSNAGTVIFHVVQVTEITGTGVVLRKKP
jgi:hypothetical protein